MGCIAKPIFVELCRKRGDSFPDEFVLFTDAAKTMPLDITGFSFILTVDPEEAPADASNNIFQLTGTITDATNGKVEYAPTAVESDVTPKLYYFDIQMTDAALAIRTIIVGDYDITQDITK